MSIKTNRITVIKLDIVISIFRRTIKRINLAPNSCFPVLLLTFARIKKENISQELDFFYVTKSTIPDHPGLTKALTVDSNSTFPRFNSERLKSLKKTIYCEK